MPKRRSKGDGAIYQRADGVWSAAVELGYVNGKRKRKIISGQTKEIVRKRLREVQGLMEYGVVPDRSTVDQWLTYWLDKVVDVRPSTMQTYRGYVTRYISPAIGRIRIDKLTAEHVRTMHEFVLSRPTASGKKLSNTTVQHAHAILRTALQQAVHDRKLVHNVAKDTKAPKMEDKPHPILTAEQSRRVLASAINERELCRLACALMLGLRQGEALGLRWSDVHLTGEDGIIVIREAVQRVKGQGIIRDKVKSARSARDVPAFPIVTAIFAAWRQVGGGEGYVFPGAKGSQLPEDHARDWRAWKAALERAGVPHVPLHGARGSAATLLQQLGVPDRVITDIMGHVDVRVTNKHYLHSDDAQRRAALELLGQRLAVPSLGSTIRP